MTEKYAVLNTEQDLLLKLGQFGPHYTEDRTKAAKKATDSHLQLIKLEFIDTDDDADTPLNE